jgi:hypothetical protein
MLYIVLNYGAYFYLTYQHMESICYFENNFDVKNLWIVVEKKN